MGRRGRLQEFRLHGGPGCRFEFRDLRRARGRLGAGERVAGVVDGRPQLEEWPRRRRPAPVIWCTGFRQAFGWVGRCPSSTSAAGRGELLRRRGDEVPGLYFSGLCFQSAAVSMVIHGAGRDAAHVARRTSPGRSRDLAQRVVAGLTTARDRPRRRRYGQDQRPRPAITRPWGDDLALGREAFARRSWTEAHEHLARRRPCHSHTAGARHALGTAAYLVADCDTAIRRLAASVHPARQEGDQLAAAMDAYWVCIRAQHDWQRERWWRLGGPRPAAARRGGRRTREARGFLRDPRVLPPPGIGATSPRGRRLRGSARWRSAGTGATAISSAFGLVRPGDVCSSTAVASPRASGLLDEAMACLTNGEVSAIASGKHLLRHDRGLPGDRGLPADERVDRGADPVVRRRSRA